MRVIGHRPQRTLARPAAVAGVGFLAGRPVTARFLPAPPDAGVAFVRTDLSPAARVPARADAVCGTNRRTTLGRGPVQVALVEHVLAALAGLRVDNCVVELDGPEPPGLDGSSAGFVEALLAAGVAPQPALRAVFAAQAPVTVAANGATLTLHPAAGPGLRVTYSLDYGAGAPIAPQRHTLELTPASFRSEIARCRTFLLDAEAAQLQAQGIGRHVTPADVPVFGPHGLGGGNRLRYADEPARHKILDVVGDLSLFGHDLAGHLVAHRSGHPLNAELARELSRRAADCAARAA